ncbi:MAG: CoA transferase, partial [Deltaproteobacteria bacterium]|nr:CoA transferase [Deltaproteobacteria bacterium]
HCSKLLADMGAEAIKVEMPCGDAARNIPPFAGDDPHREKSLYFLYRNANKLGITLNIETADGRGIFKRLVQTADVVVESRRPGYMKRFNLDYESLKQIKPDLIMASITDFGQDGPYRDWKGSDLVDFAMSGAMISTGYPDGPPTVLPGSPSDDVTSLAAATSIVTSLLVRGATGRGQYIDASIHENSRLGLFPWSLPTFFANSDPDGPPAPREVRWGTAMYPILPCKDGFIRIIAISKSQWEAFLRVFDNPETLCAPEWREFIHRIFNFDTIIETLSGPAKKFTMEELFERGNHEGVPLAPV